MNRMSEECNTARCWIELEHKRKTLAIPWWCIVHTFSGWWKGMSQDEVMSNNKVIKLGALSIIKLCFAGGNNWWRYTQKYLARDFKGFFFGRSSRDKVSYCRILDKDHKMLNIDILTYFLNEMLYLIQFMVVITANSCDNKVRSNCPNASYYTVCYSTCM